MYTYPMKMPDPMYSILQQLIIDLALIDRNHYLAGTDRRENDIEHSMAVAVLCWYLYDKLQLGLDLSKILKYAICHDFVEVHSGDVNTFASAAERQQKSVAEAAALRQMQHELARFPGLVKAMTDYEAKADEEAWFVWTVDKIQAYVLGDMDNWRPYAELTISYDEFHNKYRELRGSVSPYLADLYDESVAYFKTTYYDQPANRRS